MKTTQRIGVGAAVVLRIALGAVFTFAGFYKLIRPAEYFQMVVDMYHVAPEALVPAIAAVMPWIEFIFGFFLLVGYASRLSARVVAVLCAMFLGILVQALVRDLPIDQCGCFGGSFHMELKNSILADSAMLLVAIGLSFLRLRLPLSLDGILKPLPADLAPTQS